MNALHSFLAMGGYAAYVWPAYAIFFIMLIADSIAPRLRRRKILGELRARLARQSARQAQSAPARATTLPPSPDRGD